MSNLPNVAITLGTGASGAVLAGTDGTSGLIVSGVAVFGKFALGDSLGPFYSLADAEAEGINEDYDTTNEVVAWKHIADFYAQAGEGAELFVMVVAQTVSLTQMLDPDNSYAKTLVEFSEGKIRTLAVSRTPAIGYVPTYIAQFDTDIWGAITEAKLLRTFLFNKGIPVSFIIEGRDFQGNTNNAKDLGNPAETDAQFVSVMIGQDSTYSTLSDYAAKYAAVGHLLGRISAVQVQRNIGRVFDGPMVGIATPGLSNGEPLVSSDGTINFTDANLNTLNNSRYVFFRKINGKTGVFYNNDHCACPAVRKYSRISRCRPIDKAVRITNALYTERLLDDVELDAATGRLNAAVIKDFQASIEEEITNQMINTTTGVTEISGVSAIANPTQNVQTTNRVAIKLNIVPKGMVDGIDVELNYVNSLNE
jgi:hypothetical protein